MKKTLLLTHEYYPFKGGVARYVYNLFKFFKEQDYLVVCDHQEVADKANIIKTRLLWPYFWPSWLLAFFKLKRIIKKFKIEQIFTPNILPLGSIAYFLGQPYIISLHCLDINLALKNKPNFSKKILNKAKKIIVNSQATKQIILDIGIAVDKIELIYPSIDFDCLTDEKRQEIFAKKYNIGPTDKVLLTVGRLTKRKGQDLVIEAMDYLRHEFSLKYFIVGQGEEKEALRRLIKEKNLSDRVFICDFVDDQELVYFYHLADIFLLPSVNRREDVEGFGMVFLEAAACRRPIIAGKGAGISEIFSSDEIIFVDGGDLRQLARQIRSLLKESKIADKLADKAFIKYQSFNQPEKNSARLKRILN